MYRYGSEAGNSYSENFILFMGGFLEVLMCRKIRDFFLPSLKVASPLPHNSSTDLLGGFEGPSGPAVSVSWRLSTDSVTKVLSISAQL